MSNSEKGYYENRDLPDSRTQLEANIALEAKLEKAVGALNYHRRTFELMKKHGWSMLDIPTINEWLHLTDIALKEIEGA